MNIADQIDKSAQIGDIENIASRSDFLKKQEKSKRHYFSSMAKQTSNDGERD